MDTRNADVEARVAAKVAEATSVNTVAAHLSAGAALQTLAQRLADGGDEAGYDRCTAQADDHFDLADAARLAGRLI